MEFTPTELGTLIIGAISAFLLITQAVEKILQIHNAKKAPDNKQNERLEVLEKRMDEVDRKLNNDDARLEHIGDDNSVTLNALIALLDHGIDGNNIVQMQNAKAELLSHLTSKK